MKKTFTFCITKIAMVFAIAILMTNMVNAQSLVINEIDYDQPGIDSAEYVELYNPGPNPVNLADFKLVLFNGSTSGTGNIPYDSIQLPSQTLNAGTFFVICGNSGKVPNCNLTFTAATNCIQNAASATATSPSPDAIYLQDVQQGNIIDVVSYEGDCIAPYFETAGVPAGNSDTIVADTIMSRFYSIGRYPDGTDSNNNSVDFNRMCSTPGAANVANANGCVTAIAEVKSAMNILVYPNPTRGLLHIDMTKDYFKQVKVSVVDLLGREVKSADLGDFDAIYSLNLADLNKGVYIVKIQTANGTMLQRVELSK
ncbi:MAG: lamin tail domain-containing protein [Bacteroidota bacterium]|jgi:hypothetical protein